MAEETGRTATQRGSLKQVNATLLAQTDVLKDTQKSVLATQGLLAKSLDAQFKAASMAKLKDLEAQREGGRFTKVAGGLGAAGGAIRSGAEKGLGSISGMLSKIGSFLTPAALAALPGILGGILLKRGIPALAVGIFADEIAGFLLGPEASGELRDQVARAIQGGAIGSLLGKKFAIIGAAAGFLIDDEVAKQMLEVGKSFGSLIGADIKNLDDLKGMMLSIGNFLRDNLKAGLEGINLLLNGQIAEFFGIGEGENKLFSTLGLIAGLGLVLAPGATLGAMGFLGKKTLGLGLKALTVLWSGVPAVLRSLGLLGTAITASGATGAATSLTSTATKGATMFSVAGRGLGAMLMGPAGAIIGLGVLTAAGISAFAETEMGKRMIAKFEEEGGHAGDIAGEAAYSEDPGPKEGSVSYSELLDRASLELESASGARAAQLQNRISMLKDLKMASPNGGILAASAADVTDADIAGMHKYMANAIKKSKSSQLTSSPGFGSGGLVDDPDQARYTGVSSSAGYLLKDQTAMATREREQRGLGIVDASTNTTNNIGQSNTTISAPPPSAGQRDDYSNALQSRGDDLMMAAGA